MRSVLAGLLLAMAFDAHALTMRLCTLDHPFPPFTMPDGSGQMQELLRRAGKEDGMTIDNTIAPRLRCIAQLQAGQVDAMVAGYLPERTAYGAYPMVNDQVDDSRALGTVRFTVYTLRGSGVQWNGESFKGLNQGSVGIQVGMVAAAHLRKLGVHVDEGAKTIEQNLEKLVLGRVQAVVALENETQTVVAQRYSAQIEQLPEPFELTVIHLQVGLPFYNQHKEAVEKLWTMIRKTRESVANRRHSSGTQ